LVGAMVLSFTLVPVLALLSLRKPKPARESPILAAAARFYEPFLSRCVRNPIAVFGFAACGLAAAFVLAGKIGTEFLPELNEGALYVTFTLPGTSSLTEGRKLTPAIEERIRRTPEVVETMSQLGRPEDGTDATLPNNLEFFVKLKPMAQWRASMRTLDDISAELETNLSEIPGVEYNVSQPIRDNVNENISGQFGEIALKIYGDEMDVLQDAAAKAEAAL